VSDPLLVVEDLTVSFRTEEGRVPAVRGVSFALHPGEVLGVVGESGSGKSATALAVLGLLPRGARAGGSVRFRGRELLGAKDAALSRVRGRHVAMVFQDPMTALNPVHTIGAQVAEAVRAAEPRTPRRTAAARAVELLDLVGIPEAGRRAREHPHALSGGMRQRVVLAIAMAGSPEVIIADEPTTALDVTVQAQVLELLQLVRRTTGAAMLLITHDLGVIAGQADRVQVMYAGRVVESAAVDDLYAAPRPAPAAAAAAGARGAAVAGGAARRLPLPPAVPDGGGGLRRVRTRSAGRGPTRAAGGLPLRGPAGAR
jgi:ABC-type dipeptide/oligopeptide/nickel transport system ATPase component